MVVYYRCGSYRCLDNIDTLIIPFIAMSTSHSKLSLSAYRYLLNIHRHTRTPSTLKLEPESLLVPLLKLGANQRVISFLGYKVEYFVQVTLELRVALVHRFVTMLEVLGRFVTSSVPSFNSSSELLL